MQALSQWAPPTGTLASILDDARRRVAALRAPGVESALRCAAESAERPSAFGTALRGDTVSIIAEVKRRSPSKGAINPSLSARAQAQAYATGGAVAVSVLTEPGHFGGSTIDLEDVRDAIRLPVLKKDFHIDPLQLLEAKALRASAALLIVRALSPADLKTMVAAAADLDLEVLVEVRDAAELDRALDCGAMVIGVNNRNLESLQIDLRAMEQIIPRIPRNCIAIAESGIASATEVRAAAQYGADAVLVGSSVSAADSPAAAVRALTGVARIARDG